LKARIGELEDLNDRFRIDSESQKEEIAEYVELLDKTRKDISDQEK
jgi:hypothetical protein